jgi:Family of unknown function (DUF6445)
VIQVFDDFLPNPELVRQSAIRAGFGTWAPNKGDIGASFYSGVSFWGDHAALFRSLHERLGQIIPSSMFFRITNPSMEHALIHSDREYGDNTAIVYLSPLTGSFSGTAFYKHRESGMVDMPPLSELMGSPLFSRIRDQMLKGSDDDWEPYQFVEAIYNRCLVFDAPKIHCRIPKLGFGTTEEDSRMVWVCHYCNAH